MGQITQKLLLLALITLLLVLYYWGHNVAEQARILISGLQRVALVGFDVLLVAVICAVGAGFGRVLLHRAGLQAMPLSKPEQVALQALLGLGCISIGLLALGMLGVFGAELWLLVLLMGAVLLRSCWRWLLDLLSLLRRGLRVQTGWQRFVVLACGTLLLLALLQALAPPFAWDALTYHLEAPQRYLQDGAITTRAENHFMGFPQAVELLYGLPLALGSETAPALLHFAFGALALLACAGIVYRYTDATAAYVTILLLLSNYSLWLLFAWPYVDLAVMAYGAVTLSVLLLWRDAKPVKISALLGVLLGLAVSVKYTAAALAIAAAVFVLLRSGRRVALRNALILTAVALLAFAPWMLKGLLLYENPLYPYVHGLLGGVNWDDLRSANFSATGDSLLSGNLAWQWPILPFAATIFGLERYSPYAFTLSPWLLTLPFALLFMWRRLDAALRPVVRDLALLALPLLAFWLLLAAVSGIGAQPRLMLVAAPVPAVLGGLAYYHVSRWPRRPLDMRFMLHVLLGFTLLLGSIDVLHRFASTRALPHLANTISADAYLRANLGTYYDAMQQLGTMPQDSRVLLLWEPKAYYCPSAVQCTPDVLYDVWYRPLMQGRSVAEQAQAWRTAYDYLLVAQANYDFWLVEHEYARAENEQFPAFLAQHLQSVWRNDAYALYVWQ